MQTEAAADILCKSLCRAESSAPARSCSQSQDQECLERWAQWKCHAQRACSPICIRYGIWFKLSADLTLLQSMGWRIWLFYFI